MDDLKNAASIVVSNKIYRKEIVKSSHQIFPSIPYFQATFCNCNGRNMKLSLKDE